MSRPTIKDIARASGVSEAAVSFALNGKSGVSERTRARVLARADALGWQPNVAAQSLSADKAGALGLVIARSSESIGNESFFLGLIAGAESILTTLSLALVLQIVPSVDDEMETYRRWSSERRVDGVLLVDLRVDDPRPAVVDGLGLAAVIVGDPGAAAVPGVAINDAVAMGRIVGHLASQGHRRIAHVSGLPDLVHTKRRIDAFHAETSTLRISTAGSQPTDYSQASGVKVTQDLLAREDRPTAVIFDNEILAIAGLSSIRSARLRVPHDIAIVSWEDHVICTATDPQLTALRRDPLELGRNCASALVDLINGDSVQSTDTPVPELMIRGSSLS